MILKGEIMNDLIGKIYTTEITVTDKDTALTIGSGTAPVLATPRMAALMEEAVYKLVEGVLPEGFETVGTKLSIEHLAPTPVGHRVRAQAKLVEADGRLLKYNVNAWDETEEIGRGIHYRYMVVRDKFIQRAEGKKK